MTQNNTREIKFRAWTPNYGGVMRTPNELFIVGGVVIGANIGLIDAAGITLMQYTGLLDKNGKEIYEGDILRVNIGGDVQDSLYEVKDMRELFSEFRHDDSYYQFYEVEIVGNIYENPELLK